MIDDKLKTLLVLVEEKSYTKTAEICNITQPAVTQHIKALENYYNIEIFKRKGKELLITTEGNVLVKNAKRLVAMNQNLIKEINQSVTNIQKFDIGITLTAGDYFIPEILKLFKEKFPNTRFNFHTDIADNIIDRLKFFELDFAIIDGTPANKSFNSILLAKDELVVIGPKNHPLTKVDNVTFDLLKNENFILRHEKAHTRIAFESYLSNHLDSIDNFNVILEIDNTALIKHLIIEGHGLSIMSRAICEPNIKAGVLEEIIVKDFKLERGIYLVYPNEMSKHPLIENIIKLKKA